RGLAGTLVSEACRTAVARQVEYGRQEGVPWGISESAYGARSPEGDYQYRAFGVPGLGLKRRLERDLVIAPYATALATMIRPRWARGGAPRRARGNLPARGRGGGGGALGLRGGERPPPGPPPKGRALGRGAEFRAPPRGEAPAAPANRLAGGADAPPVPCRA